MRESELVDAGSELVDVESVVPLAGYNVRLVFSDGVERTVDLDPYLRGPIFERVRDPEYFRRVRVDHEIGTIVWPNGADIDPIVLRFDLVPASMEEGIETGVEAPATPEHFMSSPSMSKLFGGRRISYGFIILIAAIVAPALTAGLLAGRTSSLIVLAAFIAQLVLISSLSYLEVRLQRQSQRAALMLVQNMPRVTFIAVESDGQIRIVASGRATHPRPSPHARLEPATGPVESTELTD